MGKRLTYEFVKSNFEKEGYVLLSEKYVNNSTKLDCICPKGHHTTMTWGNWKYGYRCKYCAKNVK